MTQRLSAFATAVGAFGFFVSVLVPSAAKAIPSFAAQTGQPCSACHVGAFGPQLKPYGRDFKLRGYVTSDRSNDSDYTERLTVAAKTSFTNTAADQLPNAGGKGFGPNNNFAFDQGMVFYGGRITPTVGALAEVSYDGVNRSFFWDAVDIRHTHEGELFGEDYLAGVTLDNQIGNTTVWNSTPPWGFPYTGSGLAPAPQAGTLLDDALNGKVLGPGVFGLWNDLVYGEVAMYMPLSRNFQQAVGNPASDRYDGPIPYWHAALQHEFDHHAHYAQIGTFGALADRFPGTDASTGQTDHLTDIGFEANYQYLADLNNVLSFHTSLVHEKQNLTASYAMGNSSNRSDHLNSFSADATYSINDTFVPSVQYFKITGSADAGQYTSSGNGSPNSEGYTVDLAYVPFGKPDSAIQWGNARLALQYTGYTRFNGTSKNASDNNTIFLNLWLSAAPLKAIFGSGK
jgi:hypothetical protein